MALKIKTPPVDKPLTLAEVRTHCRVDHDSDDVILGLYLAAATGYVDGYKGVLGRAIMSQVWELTYDAFPSGPIEIPLGPLISVDKVEYIDPVTGAYVEFTASGNYVVDASSYQGWISPVNDWPSPRDTLNAVRITFTAGMTDPQELARIKAALLLLIGHWYENRETVSEQPLQNVKMAFDALLTASRKMTV